MTIMTDSRMIAQALAALGHEARLDVFRLLVRAGQDGLIVGDIAEHTKLPLSTLAHHLRTLVAAGLVAQERRGREVVNRADFAAMDAALSFLTAECCKGVALVREDAA
jgi:DNA-binding transcriptional ArsR family regulator